MAASPGFKVYDPSGEYVAACKKLEHAACLVGYLGRGSQIRVDHAKRFAVWTEGGAYEESVIAGYVNRFGDVACLDVAGVCMARITEATRRVRAGESWGWPEVTP